VETSTEEEEHALSGQTHGDAAKFLGETHGMQPSFLSNVSRYWDSSILCLDYGNFDLHYGNFKPALWKFQPALWKISTCMLLTP
jgi:hypothetical protein